MQVVLIAVSVSTATAAITAAVAAATITATAVTAAAFLEAAATAAKASFLEAAFAAALFRTGFVDDQITTIHFAAVQLCNGSLCLFVVWHVNKAKAFAAVGEFVHNDFRRRYFTERCE